MYTNFEKLDIYNDSVSLAQEIWELTIRIKGKCPSYLTNQICRAADSIGANIAEGCGKGSRADKRRFVVISRGSGFEVKHWLKLLHLRGYMSQHRLDTLSKKLNILLRRLSSFIRSLS